MQRLHEENERFWAPECLELYNHLLIMNNILSLKADDTNNAISFLGISVKRLLSNEELDDLRCRGAIETAPFVPGP